MTLEDIETPCLVLDTVRMARNIARLKARLEQLNVPLRPHLKTCKSVEVSQLLMPAPAGPAAASTLKEAEVFADAGVRDILYAVGIAPAKLPRVVALRKRGVNVCVVLDSVEQADAVIEACRQFEERIPVLIEIDSDNVRAGVRPGDSTLLEIAERLQQGGAELRGVMTHAGGSYNEAGTEFHVAMAEQERAAAVRCATDLRGAGFPCPVVSVGSTPTAHAARRLDGVTEVRAGVFVFFDLVMAGIGVCGVEDIALSVLSTVIGHQREKGWILVDAGWMALSRDRGTAAQAVDQGYGVVCDLAGKPYRDLVVEAANQEHGIVAVRKGSGAKLPELGVGARVRILPNHACATGAQHSGYFVTGDDGLKVDAVWPRFSGW